MLELRQIGNNLLRKLLEIERKVDNLDEKLDSLRTRIEVLREVEVTPEDWRPPAVAESCTEEPENWDYTRDDGGQYPETKNPNKFS